MPKNTCSCANDSNKEYTNEAPTFRTHYLLDNAFIPIFNNPSRTISDLVQNGAPNSLVDRVNCLSCDDSVSTQDKLKVRKKDRPTPYRVPYNHFRKVTSCKSDCITNVKINKDLSCNNLDCVPTTYALSRLVDKNGVRNLNNGGNYKNYLQSSGKNYDLNTYGILPECAVSGELHTYKIGSVEGTVLNKNSKTNVSNNCQLGYSYTTSLNDKSFSLIKMNTTTKKYSNPYHNTSGSVSSKAHIHKKKFRNILAGQSIGKKDGYNNCRNGEFCNLYMKPGPNTKLFMGKTSIQRCIPPRIRGLKQLCDYNLDVVCIASNKYTNPKFQRNDYLTEQDGGFLKISFEHCDLNINSQISITFLGATTAADHIFAPSVDTNVSSYITTSYTNQHLKTTSSGEKITEILNYTITNLIVNKNTIKWIMPVSVKKGTSYLTLFDGGDNIAINNANGIPGRVYANVSITGHPTLNSHVAWDIIFPPVDCSTRNDTLTTSSPTLGNSTAAVGDNINSISIPLTTNNSSSILIDDIIQITFYTTYSIGFFNSNVDSEGFGPGANQSSWSLNTTSSNESPSIKFENEGGIVTNGISSAIWNGTTNPVNIYGTTFYKQDLYITVGANLTTTSTDLVINNNTTSGGTPEINNIPTSLFSIKYQVSASCFTSTSISTIREILDICYYRQLSGTGVITPYGDDAFGIYNEVANEPVGASIPGVVSYNPGDAVISFVYSNENFIQGDIIILELYSTYPNGYLNRSNYPNGISNWNNSNSYDGIPKLRIKKYNPNTFETISTHSYTSAVWNTSNDTTVFIGSTLYYKQTISITLDNNPPTITGSNQAIQITLARASTLSNEETITYTKLLTDHPTSAATIKYSISCNCYTGTGIQTGYSFQGPCYNRNGSFTNTSMSIANYVENNDPVIVAISNYGPTNNVSISPDIVLFTFSLTSDNLKGGDVISFRITTDYGSNDSGYFTNYGAGPNVTWNLNEKPDGNFPDNIPSVWLQQGNTVLSSPSGIESISFSNSSYNTNTNVYTQIIYVTIGYNVTSILSNNGALTLGIYGGNDIIAQHPSSTYYVYYEIDSYCWTSTGTQNGYSYDPCSGRSGSLTNSELTVTGFDSTTAGTITGGDFIELAELEFTATGAALLGGDILLLKLIVDYQDQTGSTGFWTETGVASGITLNSQAFTEGGAALKSCWITLGTNTTPVSGMIDSISITATTSGNPVNKWIQVMSITLAGTPTTTYGSIGSNWKINIQGEDNNSTVNITQTSYLTGGSIDYELDLNCFTGTGEQEGVDWPANPCYGRGTGTLAGISVTTYPTNLVGGGDELEYQIIQLQNSNDSVRGGDVITIKFRTTYNSFFTGSMSNSDWYKNNDNPTSNDKPRVYLYLFDSQTNSSTTLNAISTATTSSAVQDGNKWIQTVTLTLISGSTVYAPAGSNLMIYIRADNLTNTSSYITQPSANTGGTVEHEVDINCFTNTSATFASQNLVYSYAIAGSLTSLSLLPNNFEGFQRTSYGLGENLDTIVNGGYPESERQRPFFDFKGRQGYNPGYGSTSASPEASQFYTNNQINADKYLRNITSRFSISKALPSGSSIKITFWKENDTSINSWDRSFFNSGAVGTNTTASEPFTLTGGYNNNENLYIEGKYNTGGNDTVFTFSAYTISSYSGNEQSIILTTNANIPANANVKIIFYDHQGDALNSNTREGRGIYYDLEITPASSGGIPVVFTKQEDNLAWYSQDISFNHTYYGPPGGYIFSNTSVPTIITYRHHSAIPSGSKIKLIWSGYQSFADTGDYNFFKGHGTTTENLISNTSTPSTGNVGIIVESHTTLSSTSGTNINISDFELGTMVAALNNGTNTGDSNHGSVEYLEFEIDNNIAGESVSKTTNAATRFIEIKFYGGHNLRPVNPDPSNPSSTDDFAKVYGDIRFTIEVRNSNNILIGSIYNFRQWQKP